MKKLLVVLMVLLSSAVLVSAQTKLVGVVKTANTEDVIPGVNVTVLQQNLSVVTNVSGKFEFAQLEAGTVDVRFFANGYIPRIVSVVLADGQELDLGTVTLLIDAFEETRQEVMLQMMEADFDEDEGRVSQSGIAASISKDVYLSQSGYSFSPMRFRTRGYDNKYESTYINGVHFVDAERGGFNYSSIGGLNNATRDKDLTYGLTANTFSFGNIGANTNINTRASRFAPGSNANLALSNRSYTYRGQYTYATGLMENGWAFAISGVVRYANEGRAEGTFYNSGGLFLSAEKVFNDQHSLSLVAFGAPTRRAGQSAITKEVRDLTGSIYYNPYWGNQNGKKRNSRVVESFDPTAVLSYEWKISNTQRFRAGFGVHHSSYSNSAFAYNGLHPSPDYYRNMPSFPYNEDGSLRNETTIRKMTELWGSDVYTQQVKWDEAYFQNAQNNASQDSARWQARNILERRHNNLLETAFNAIYTNMFTPNLKFTAGIGSRNSKGMHYKTVDDLLGAVHWVDFDTYADRDMIGSSGTLQDADPNIIQNDVDNPDRKVKEGEIFGYNYDMNILSANVYAQLEYTTSHFNAFAGVKGTYTHFYRDGHMENGRAWYLREIKGENVISKGKSKTWFFTDPSVKAGVTYRPDHKNRISANVLAETRAPLVRDAYVSERIKDVLVKGLTNEKILSYDLNYEFNYSFLRGRVSGFRTHVLDAIEKLGYYDDSYRTFVNHSLSDVDKIFQGVELGVSIPINRSFTLSSGATYADYRYTSNAIGTKSPDNGAFADIEETILTKDLKIASGPQFAANITLDYFHPKMWFVDVTLNYYDNNYLDFAPNRFTEENQKQFQTMNKNNPKLQVLEKLGTQEKLKGGFMLDASIGKLIYTKNRNQININLSASNILNNVDMITGGYQQARIPRNSDKSINTQGLDWFPNKYYYAWGVNFFLHVGYKF